MKKTMMIATLAISTLLLAGCSANVTELDSLYALSPLTLEQGTQQTVELQVKVDKENATKEDIDKAVEKADFIWTVSNDKIATVQENVLTAHEKGETQVVVTSKDSKYKTTFDVSVIVSVKDFTVLESAEIFAGETMNVLKSVTPENANVEQILYTSSDEKIATVDLEGDVKGVAKGKCVITATRGEVTKTTDITVEITATAIELEKSEGTLTVGGSYTLKPTLAPNDCKAETMTFTSSDEKIATVTDKGAIKAKKAGTVTITVKSEKGLEKTYSLTIKAKAAAQAAAPAAPPAQGSSNAPATSTPSGESGQAAPPAAPPVAPPAAPPVDEGIWVSPGDGSLSGGF